MGSKVISTTISLRRKQKRGDRLTCVLMTLNVLELKGKRNCGKDGEDLKKNINSEEVVLDGEWDCREAELCRVLTRAWLSM